MYFQPWRLAEIVFLLLSRYWTQRRLLKSKIIEILCQIWITYTHPISMFLFATFLFLSLNFANRNGQNLTHHICLIRILLECMDFYKKNKNYINKIGKYYEMRYVNQPNQYLEWNHSYLNILLWLIVWQMNKQLAETSKLTSELVFQWHFFR